MNEKKEKGRHKGPLKGLGINLQRLYMHKFALSQPRGGGGKGYRNSSCPLQGIALYGGIAEIVSPIAV